MENWSFGMLIYREKLRRKDWLWDCRKSVSNLCAHNVAILGWFIKCTYRVKIPGSQREHKWETSESWGRLKLEAKDRLLKYFSVCFGFIFKIILLLFIFQFSNPITICSHERLIVFISLSIGYSIITHSTYVGVFLDIVLSI